MDPTSKLQALRDHELERWLEQAMGLRQPDPEPVIRDLDD